MISGGLFQSRMGCDNTLPLTGTIFMSIRDEDKPHIVRVARKMQDAGLHLLGTRHSCIPFKERDKDRGHK